ncbi:MAG: ribosome biogenesis GTPase Der [Bdellovibrionaceae bacterium]|nr:ribosome biogenesis GTPase Der [Pseudobdellovibrionaceae bacterium]
MSLRNETRIAIIGRPNVGKSTLFNMLTETRKAVVKDQPGVTRDIQIEPAEIWGTKFDLIDTGGLTEATDTFSQMIHEQVVDFLKSVDLLIVVMDGRAGLIPEDRDVIRIAKETGKPFVLVVNKVDSVTGIDAIAAEFYEFGRDVLTASFERRLGVSELCEWIVAHVKKEVNTVREGLTLAIVGKPNVGKSSLTNRLLGENRQLVSDIAGTTVDAVDTQLIRNDKKYILIDTAGLRKQAKREEDVEIISAFKSIDAIRRADIVLLMVDGSEGPSTQDAKILEEILKRHKGVILVANKIDVGERQIPMFRQWFKERATDELHFFETIPMAFISAKTGRGLPELFTLIDEIERKLNAEIPTGELNDFFMSVIRQAPAPVYGTKDVKFYYLTQTHQVPPSFIAFANHPDGVTPGYRRFLSKRLAEKFDLVGVPIRIFVMKSRKGSNG